MRASNRGFTIIEVMLVVLIIGIITSIAIPFYQGMTARASRSEAQVVLSKMRVHFISLYENQGTFESAGKTAPYQSLTNPPVGGPTIGQGATWDPTPVEWKDLAFPPEGLIKMRYLYKVIAPDQLWLMACGSFPGLGPRVQACGDLGNSAANYTYVELYQGTSQIAASPVEIPAM